MTPLRLSAADAPLIVETVALALPPQNRIQQVKFLSPLDPATGKPAPWTRARGPLDGYPWGVYLLWEPDTQEVYAGSSAGTKAAGALRRTVNRHFQIWEHADGRPGGYTLSKERGGAAVFPTATADEARQLEDDTIALLWSYCAESGACELANFKQVYAGRVKRIPEGRRGGFEDEVPFA